MNFPFQRLQSDLAALINKMNARERLPSEPELARRMGVSRATLREAMRTFEVQGLIRRRQGSGTFVVGRVPVIEAGLELFESLETMAERVGLEVPVSDPFDHSAVASFGQVVDLAPHTLSFASGPIGTPHLVASQGTVLTTLAAVKKRIEAPKTPVFGTLNGENQIGAVARPHSADVVNIKK